MVGLLSIIPIMNNLLEQRFFRLLSEYSQRKVSVTEFTEAIEELATHLADFSVNEQDYSVFYVIFLLACIVLNRIVYGLSKKKIPYLHLIDEAIELIKTEVRIVNLRIKYPNSSSNTQIRYSFPLSISRQDKPYQYHGNCQRFISF